MELLWIKKHAMLWSQTSCHHLTQWWLMNPTFHLDTWHAFICKTQFDVDAMWVSFSELKWVQTLQTTQGVVPPKAFQLNSIFYENHYHDSLKKLIMTKFYTYQDSTAVLVCVKFCYDQTDMRWNSIITIKFEIHLKSCSCGWHLCLPPFIYITYNGAVCDICELAPCQLQLQLVDNL